MLLSNISVSPLLHTKTEDKNDKKVTIVENIVSNPQPRPRIIRMKEKTKSDVQVLPKLNLNFDNSVSNLGISSNSLRYVNRHERRILSDRPTHFVEGIRNANFIHQEREEGLKAKLELHNICRSINTIIKECDSVQKDEELRNILYSDNFSNLFGPNKEAIKKKKDCK